MEGSKDPGEGLPPVTTRTRSGGTMRVHVHTKFCFLCMFTFLFHQCNHCHGEGHHQHPGHHHGDDNHAHNDLQISQDPYTTGATTPSPGFPRSADTSLEVEQNFYIQQLFRRYGQTDQLNFEGFQSLLVSLGLGEVKVVDVEHEEIGHDHVSHLDLLDVQEGLHSHLPTDDDHGHRHDQGHGHGHSHPKPGSPNPQPTLCSKQATGDSPPAASGSRAEHEHSHDPSHHEHDHGHDSDAGHGDTKVQDNNHRHSHGQMQVHTSEHDPGHDHAHDPDHDHNQEIHPHHQHNHSHHDRKGPDHPEHVHTQPQTSTGVPPRRPEQPLLAQQASSRVSREEQPEATLPEAAVPSAHPVENTDARAKKPRKPTRARGQQGRNKPPSATLTPPPGEQGHNTHGHKPSHLYKDKREAPGEPVIPMLPGPALPGHPEDMSHQHEECLNLTQLLTYYGLSPTSLISPSHFTYLCPALLYQIDSRVCIRHYHQVEVEEKESFNSVWVWLWGFVSITIISLLSLLGVILVPILNQSCFKFLLTFLVALAVGTLSGDALLHLLPHSQGQHDHSLPPEGERVAKDLLVEFDSVWKGLTALAGIYLLFIIEHCLCMFKVYKDQGGSLCSRKSHREEGKIGRKLSDHKLNRRSDAEWLHLKPLTEGLDSTIVSCDNGHNDTQLSDLQAPDSPTKQTATRAEPQQEPQSPNKENGSKAKKHSHGHGHSHGGNCHSDQEMKDAGIASIAWMVIMGDGMHNFSDGLAIGAAFSANITGGISTSVAVFCHELPHELGDFAVLLKAGMSVKQAIVYNLLSALMAYVGMVIGTIVGQYTHNVTSWIFAATAGMFLYVALVDMLPEMLHGDSEEHKRCQLGHFVLQNLGMMTGFAIMLLIAIFEDRIVFDFGF